MAIIAIILNAMAALEMNSKKENSLRRNDYPFSSSRGQKEIMVA